MSHAGARIQVEQRTPNRVAHRRADKTRERWSEICEISPCEGAELEYLVRCRIGSGCGVPVGAMMGSGWVSSKAAKALM